MAGCIFCLSTTEWLKKDIGKDIKEASHKLILREKSLFPGFPGWQVGYSGFTYQISARDSLINYVRN
ncbi:MAG: hypothetical protein WCE64_01025, partial [Bacteroidales bacterium]